MEIIKPEQGQQYMIKKLGREMYFKGYHKDGAWFFTNEAYSKFGFLLKGCSITEKDGINKIVEYQEMSLGQRGSIK